MSRILTAKDICSRALRMIGAFPITESAADGEHMREAMHWLDLIIAEVAGTERIFSIVPGTIRLPIENGTASYDLNVAFGSDLPPDRIQFPVSAWIEDGGGNRSPAEIVSLDTFESQSKPDANGPPHIVHIDRLASPTLRIFPVPTTGDPAKYTLVLAVQTYAPNVAPGGITGSHPRASILTEFRQAWQRFLVLSLAHDLGSGPIAKIGEASLTRFERGAAAARRRLLAFENREHTTTPPVCLPWGM